MSTRARTHCFSLAGLALLAPGAVAAQCPAWQTGFAPVGPNTTVKALATQAGATAPDLVIAGQFVSVNAESSYYRIARWDGEQWSRFGVGLTGTVLALAHYDTGAGSELYAGGEMLPQSGPGYIARWDGSTWQPLGAGTDGVVHAMCTYDDGLGARLYVGGAFANAGGQTVSRLASWDGSTWLGVGGGVDGIVRCMTVHDDGTGNALYVGGDFALAGGAPAARVARWDGSTWSPLGTGLNGSAYALQSHAGNLYVGGAFTTAGSLSAAYVARWDGSSWSDVGGGTNAQVRTMLVHDDGAGARLVAGGDFSQAGGSSAPAVAAFDGTSWSPLAGGLGGTVHALATWDDGAGTKLVAGGNLALIGSGTAQHVATWDGTRWATLSQGLSTFPGHLAELDDGSGPALWVGGNFTSAGGQALSGLARWKDEAWSGIPGLDPTTFVQGLVANTDPLDRALYFSSVTRPSPGVIDVTTQRWDGTHLTTVADSGAGRRELTFFDDGNGRKLYGSNGIFVGRLEGSTFVDLPLGSAVFPRSLHVHDDGSGAALYVGGATVVLRWDGTTATVMGDISAFDDSVEDLETWDDGTGPALYAVGRNMRVARWSGASWVQVAPATLPPITGRMTVFDDGSGAGERLFVSTASAVTGMYVLGASGWTPYASQSTHGDVDDFQVHRPSPDAPAELWAAGGVLRDLGGVQTQGLARLRLCDETGATFCHGDGSASACPCGNESQPGERQGCRHSLGQGGALRARGSASLSNDGVALRGSSMPNSSALYFQGASVANGGLGVPFGDGIKCTGGPFIRLATRSNVAGASQFPSGADLSVSARGQVHAPGTRHYQVRYRNAAPFCSSETFNYTNAVSIAWGV